MTVRRIYTFKGRVQGVGFRYTAKHYANQLGLAGWVKNEYDGSVVMEVQGSPERIAALVNHLSNDTYIRVTSCTYVEIPVVEGDRGFGVKSWY